VNFRGGARRGASKRLYSADLLASTGEPNGIAAAVISRIAGEVFGLTVPPDVYGSAALRVDGVDYPDLTQSLAPTEEDAFTVTFDPPAGWSGFAAGESIRIFVTLRDEDLSFDDPIGTVTLTEEDLRQAWNDSPDDLHWVKVSDQMQAVLFIRVLVRASP